MEDVNGVQFQINLSAVIQRRFEWIKKKKLFIE